MPDDSITYAVVIDDPRLDGKVIRADKADDPASLRDDLDDPDDTARAAIEVARQNIDSLALFAARDWADQRDLLDGDLDG